MADPATPSPGEPGRHLASRRAATYAAVAVALGLLSAAASRIEWLGTAELHTNIEIAATLLALLVGALALARHFAQRDETALFIGVGFVGTALFDAHHAFFSSAALHALFPSAPNSLLPWSWGASRLFLGVIVLLSWWAWRREQRLGEAAQLRETTVYASIALLSIANVLMFALVPLPDAHSALPFFGRPQEFLPGVLFLLALIAYLRKGAWRSDAFEHWLVLSLIVGTFGQVAVMSRSFALFDTMFDLAHLLKVVSYACLFNGLLIRIYHLFRDAASHSMALTEANQALRTEVALRMDAEKQLRGLNEDLVRSNTELEQFAYVASHDLQEPLRMVASYMELLERRYKDQLDHDARVFISYAVDGTLRMKQLIRDLLTYSRLGRPEEKRPVSCQTALDHAIANLEVAIRESGAEITVDPLPIVMADRSQMAQLFQNLVGNAIKYRHDDRTPRIYVSAEVQGSDWAVAVRDNGIGIDPRGAERIFAVFQRLHGTGQYEGTGIGLALCKKIVEQHDGRIWMESEPGEGTTFFFTMPQALGAAADSVRARTA